MTIAGNPIYLIPNNGLLLESISLALPIKSREDCHKVLAGFRVKGVES